MENILSLISLKEVFCQTGEKLSIDFCFRIEKGEVGYESTYRGSRFFGFD